MTIRDHYTIRYRDIGQPIGDADLDRNELALELQFPKPYREFLLSRNGGVPSPACFLVNHVESTKIERFHSIDSPEASTDVLRESERLRRDFQMPADYLSIARTEGDGALLLCCSGEKTGRLYHWPQPADGFRLNDPDFDTVFRLYFQIEEMTKKLGPARNRDDIDALFLRLYWGASRAQSGAQTAEKLVSRGYDVNFVLPGFRHPVFAAIDSDAFNVAQALIALGTRPDHIDPLHGNATVIERLSEPLAFWKNRMSESKKGDAVYEMAVRRIKAIEAALDLFSNGSRD